jgi:hypothetical protein
VQSPTDGEVAIHHFAESGVMELVGIILKFGEVGGFIEIYCKNLNKKSL